MWCSIHSVSGVFTVFFIADALPPIIIIERLFSLSTFSMRSVEVEVAKYAYRMIHIMIHSANSACHFNLQLWHITNNQRQTNKSWIPKRNPLTVLHTTEYANWKRKKHTLKEKYVFFLLIRFVFCFYFPRNSALQIIKICALIPQDRCYLLFKIKVIFCFCIICMVCCMMRLI